MDEPRSLDSLFKQRIFRIPDYQRGYAWQREQIKDFWEDLINLSESRSHYTGVLTLKQILSAEIAPSDKEYWLVEDHSYEVYHVVDGQQRLTTFIIFLQAFVSFVKALPEHANKTELDIYVTDSLNVAELQDRYLFKVKPTGDRFRTYKFGYTEDNPSYDYLRHRILGEAGGTSLEETFYTLNLGNALRYFTEQLRNLHKRAGAKGLQAIYKALTKRFLFNEYVIKDEFDVFVAFETMNNRGKKLSDLELLKNRLIYLTTLYSDGVLDAACRKSLRDTINGAWKEVYHQLGRNKAHPLNDDDFLRAHWIMYFKYSRKTGQDYIRYLLDEQFTPKRVQENAEGLVDLERSEEQRWNAEEEEQEADGIGATEEASADSAEVILLRTKIAEAEAELRRLQSEADRLKPTDIRDFVGSLEACAVHWFNSFYPDLAEGMSTQERSWIHRLNRVGMGYFRPLVMAVLKNEKDEAARIRTFQRIERFIFIAFRMSTAKANYRSSEYYNAARAFDRQEITLDAIATSLDENLDFAMNDDGTMRPDEFHTVLFKKFKAGDGYYGWPGLRYFLFEYEASLLSESRQSKVSWDDLLKSERDRISIEHIYPQSETAEWDVCFSSIPKDHRSFYNSTLGNLLLLSMSINSSLQNDSFDEKRRVKCDAAGKKLRNGYADGSHSEIEVSANTSWGPEQIKARGVKLLKFMETRWAFQFKSDEDREKLLFLNCEAEEE